MNYRWRRVIGFLTFMLLGAGLVALSTMIGIKPFTVTTGIFPVWAVGILLILISFWIVYKSFKYNKEVATDDTKIRRKTFRQNTKKSTGENQ